MNKTIFKLLFLLSAASFNLTACAGYRGDSTVMMQGFHWTSWQTSPWWNVVEARAPEMAAAGINTIWLPPSQDSSSPEGYMARRLYVQDSSYGSAKQLAAAISVLHANGIKVLADVILNHRVGTRDWADLTEPAWGPETICVDDEWKKGTGAVDTGKPVPFARDIDHTNTTVQKGYVDWLNWLRTTFGYDGWRYDYARGFAPNYLLGYNRATNPMMSVAEIWDDLDLNNPDLHRQAMCKWMDQVKGEIKVFDFTTKGILQYAVATGEFQRLADNTGRPSGLIGWWPSNAITFIDNHDTVVRPGSKERNWPFPSDKMSQGYAYILTHPGIPCVYWQHFFDWGIKEELVRLLKVRKAAGINSLSDVKIVRASQGIYAAVIDGRVALRLGAQRWEPGNGWNMVASGSGYTVWMRK